MEALDEGKKEKKAAGGAPKWVVTFADLMSLLLTFFVLLLSMSTIDATKFRKINGSLKMAFGVQRVSVFDETPAGTSFIQEEYRAGSTSAAPLSVGGATVNIMDPQLQNIKNSIKKNEQIAAIEKQKRLDTNVKKTFDKLQKEIKEGKVEITKDDDKLVIRISESAAFPEKNSKLSPGFTPLLEKLSDIVLDVKGDVIIAGHTDDKNIKTPAYKTNWEFSAARANNFAQALMTKGDVDPDRITVQFHGPTKPVVRNNSDINRRKNRRIELIIKH